MPIFVLAAGILGNWNSATRLRTDANSAILDRLTSAMGLARYHGGVGAGTAVSSLRCNNDRRQERMNRGPNLFVIGATKCGTTLFHDLLDQHPDIFMSRPKELWHFNRTDHLDNEQRYLSHFSEGAGFPVRGESTPIYSETLTFPHVPAALRDFCPSAKIIYLVREPFSRFRSQWRQTLDSGHWAKDTFYEKRMPLSYRDAVFSHPPFLVASKYWTNLQNFRRHFPDDAIKVLLFEEFVKDPVACIKNVFSFLGVDAGLAVDPAVGNPNSSAGKSVYSPITSWVRRRVPIELRQIVPLRLRQTVRDAINGLTAPEFDHSELSSEDVESLKRTLRPEVQGLYTYLGIEDDPWNFLGGTRNPASDGKS